MRRTILGVFACWLLLCGAAWACHDITAESGKAICVSAHFRVDKQGREWPVKIQVTQPPAHGRVTTRVGLETVTLRGGERRVVHATQVVYQSKKGYIGEDQFTYLRLTSDPTDPNNNRSVTITVTMR